MSTICKLDPTVRKSRAQRATIVRSFLKNGTLARLDHKVAAIGGQMIAIHRDPRRTGGHKHERFRALIRRAGGET